MGFEKWAGCHQDPEQQKRRAKAQDAACTPLSVDVDNKTGAFSGSSGVYRTTLEDCTCVDFRRRKMPCKHMYRLAIEVGAFEGEVVSDVSKIKRPKPDGYSLADAVAIIENLSDDARELLCSVLGQILYGEKKEKIGIKESLALKELARENVFDLCDDPAIAMEACRQADIKNALINAGIDGFKKNLKKELMIAWAFENVPNAAQIIPGYACVKLNDAFIRPARKLYTYLCRRNGRAEYDTEAVMAADGSVKVVCQYPNDEVTHLLDLYGVNPCSDMITEEW